MSFNNHYSMIVATSIHHQLLWRDQNTTVTVYPIHAAYNANADHAVQLSLDISESTLSYYYYSGAESQSGG